MRTELKEDEKLVLLIRTHWFVLVWPSLFVFIGVILWIIIYSYGGSYGYLLIPSFAICYLGYAILQRSYNLWAVSNLRVIDEFGVFSHNSKESPIDKINNITYSQSILGRLFGFGNVQIQTAAEIGSTTYYTVENPKELKDTITLMQEEYKKAQILSQAQELAKAILKGKQSQSKTEVADEIEKLFDLMKKGILTEEEFTTRKKKILET